MKNNKGWRVVKELFMNDLIIGTCFWALILLLFIPLLALPPSLEVVLYIFLAATGLICLPFAIYRISIGLYLAQKGVEVTATNVSMEIVFFGRWIKFEYEFDGQTYQKVKFYHSVFFIEKDRLKLLVDPGKPARFIIFEFQKKSIISVVKERKPE